MRHEVMDLKLELGQARPIEFDIASVRSDNPAIAALSPRERDIWDLAKKRIPIREISILVGLNEPWEPSRKDLVSRIINGIRDKIKWLFDLREILLRDPHAIDLFLEGKHCGRVCPKRCAKVSADLASKPRPRHKLKEQLPGSWL